LCGEKTEVSKLPSWRWVTGMPMGDSSEVRTEVKEDRAATMLDSGAWKGGDRLEMMQGVRTRTDGFGGGPGYERWGVLGEARSGRKDCRVRMGDRRRVFRMSLSVEGDRVAIGEEG
jgi:hypothetical protein